jgi:[acyl-carrier-protein] S-malonyltransferase
MHLRIPATRPDSLRCPHPWHNTPIRHVVAVHADFETHTAPLATETTLRRAGRWRQQGRAAVDEQQPGGADQAAQNRPLLPRYAQCPPRLPLHERLTVAGQGVQRVGMCTPWLEAFPRTVKPMLDEIDATLGLALTRTIESGTNAELTRTENAQPAIMATSIMILRIMERDFGFNTSDRVDITLGHSLGEFAALVAGGYLTFPAALKMVRRRAEVMSQCSAAAVEHEGGEFGMVALVCESESHMQSLVSGVREFLDLSGTGSKSDSADHLPAVQQVAIANLNSKNQIVLSGSIARINTLLANLRQFGGHDPRHVRLKSDSPFHNPLMKPAQEVMQRILHKENDDGSDIVTWPGVMPCISNVTGKPFQDKEQLKNLLARSCAETVQWWKSVKYLHEQEKVRRYVGIGPGKVGRNLVGKEVGMKGKVKGGGVWGITSPKEMEEVVRALEETEGGEDE